MKSNKTFFSRLCILVSVLLLSISADAKTHSQKKKSQKHANVCHTQLLSGDIVPCTKSPSTSLVLDYHTGKVLHAERADAIIYPASLAKVMTLYLAFEALKKGKISMNQKIYVSAKAASMPPCKLGVKSGAQITVKDAVLGTIVRSGNDTAVSLGETISGSEDKFVALMNKRASTLGMRNTKFSNPTGWFHPDQKTTPIDLAKLTMAIRRDFPEYYPLFSSTQFTFNGRVVRGHNRVTANYEGAEGMKTGFNNPAGANLITTASRDGKTLIGVVTGSSSGVSRDKKMITLLDKHFGCEHKANFSNVKSKQLVASKVAQSQKTPKKNTKVLAYNKKKSKPHKRAA